MAFSTNVGSFLFFHHDSYLLIKHEPNLPIINNFGSRLSASGGFSSTK